MSVTVSAIVAKASRIDAAAISCDNVDAFHVWPRGAAGSVRPALLPDDSPHSEVASCATLSLPCCPLTSRNPLCCPSRERDTPGATGPPEAPRGRLRGVRRSTPLLWWPIRAESKRS